MRFDEEDLVVLSSELVGSKMSGVLATPEERRGPSDSSYYDRTPVSRSKYDRYYRPTLELFKKRAVVRPHRGSHEAVDVAFILPLANSYESASCPSVGNLADSQMFYGRPVSAHVDMKLAQQWFRTCCMEHKGAEPEPGPLSPPKRRHTPFSEHEGGTNWCLPTPRPRIPHFRLIHVQKQCVVLARDGDSYAALSYVWGQAKRLLLTTETLQQLSTPGALSPDKEEVPRTFKDALRVAEQLEVAFVWIDALCVMQDNEEQLVQHMDVMDSIYGSATLTIVSDAASADSGIPGISLPRGPPQAILNHGSRSYISAKRTFGKSLTSDSCWESRAWCLQEKVFSLLVFTGHQAFYHCAATTWFEDTIMEPREKNRITTITIAERSNHGRKDRGSAQHTAYEAHRKLFERNFLRLLEEYTKRQLSFESDAIRAFSGILSSMESQHGPAIWGVPEYIFARGISWSQSRHKMDARRRQFPSWSWAGWRGNDGSTIRFGNVWSVVSDMWKIDWHYHKFDRQTRKYELTAVQHWYRRFQGVVETQRPRHKRGRQRDPPPESSGVNTPLPESSMYLDNAESAGEYRALHKAFEEESRMYNTWALPDHPNELGYVELEMPPFTHDPTTMPPISHIIRFFTSCARVWIDAEPDLEYPEKHYQWYSIPKDGSDRETFFAIRSLSPEKQILGRIPLDPNWSGRGKEHELVYISPSFWPPSDQDLEPEPIIFWVMLVEDLEGAPGVKSRVSMYGPIDITTWRMAKPVWKCVTLA
ncbi:heterokaryon incompatibility protein-domain-containing protein [Immersiella caudata]|uniref:Heterokaryon incompatibility protein-domain-containing protein n=1 Tax=Immersiella caudata TaxID=314043 RepID=A0AA39WE17_9PEZI|nr:heterokaryon incompatibility protein-domain-containing protein [Immersiella caudata]